MSHWKPELSYLDVDNMPDGAEKAIQLAINGLFTDGGHHKQWVLERILVSLGVDLNELKHDVQEDGYDWDSGIAP